MAVLAEHTAAKALREYLLLELPAKVTTINTERAAVLKAARAGPYTIPSGGSLPLGIVPGSEVADALTSGSRTAAQVASDLSTSGITASADTQGRLVLTATAAPVEGTPSVVALGADSTGTSALFGWDAGGEEVTRYAVIAPTYRGIKDGEYGPLDVGQGFGIIIGNKTSTDTDGNPRREDRDVMLELALHVPLAGGTTNDYSEHVSQCVRAVRECIHADRTLDGVIQYSEVAQAVALGPVFRLAEGAGPIIARADMRVRCRVFERS